MGDSLFSRRRFLGACLGAGGFVLMGGAGVAALRGVAPDVDGLRILTEQEHRTLMQLARALFPAAGTFSVDADEADLGRRFDAFLADEPPWNQSDLKKALLLLELAPLWMDRRLATFSNLPGEERLALFERWQRSDSLLLRQASVGLFRPLAVTFYDEPAAWPHIGYDGPVLKGAAP